MFVLHNHQHNCRCSVLYPWHRHEDIRRYPWYITRDIAAVISCGIYHGYVRISRVIYHGYLRISRVNSPKLKSVCNSEMPVAMSLFLGKNIFLTEKPDF